jgi:pSer/pThr/pTyr-binding forkhead associated (FHA) protein
MAAMPQLKIGTDRCALRSGPNVLGGRAAGALPIAGLAWQPAVATITIPDVGAVLIQRITASVVVRLNDVPLGVAPVELRDGAHIDIAGCRLIFDAFPTAAPPDLRVSAAESPALESAHADQAHSVIPEPLADARLVNVRTGEAFELSGRRISVGRDGDCDLVLHDNGVSRRHASVAPVPGGYLLTDESSNGTIVNGARIGGTRILDHGDLLRMHDEELRFEVVGAESSGPATGGSRAATTVLDMTNLRSMVAAEGARSANRRSPTATLEIVRGPFAGASFQIDRPVCSIGRGDLSDVRLRDESVSSAHATLLRKGDTWYVVDLRSVNGTYVEGYGVAGERELHTGVMLRVGAVEMIFRSFVGGVEEASARPKGGVARWLKGLLR